MINLLKYLLPPPLSNGLPMLAGLLLILLRWRRMGLLLATTGTITLLLLSLPLVSHPLQSSLEIYPAITRQQLQQNEILVVLGGGQAFSGVAAAAPLCTVQFKGKTD